MAKTKPPDFESPFRKVHLVLSVVIILGGLLSQVVTAAIWKTNLETRDQQALDELQRMDKRLSLIESWIEKHQTIHTDQIDFQKDIVHNMRRLMEKNNLTYQSLEVRNGPR